MFEVNLYAIRNANPLTCRNFQGNLQKKSKNSHAFKFSCRLLSCSLHFAKGRWIIPVQFSKIFWSSFRVLRIEQSSTSVYSLFMAPNKEKYKSNLVQILPYPTTAYFLFVFAGFEITMKNHCDGDIFGHSFRLQSLKLCPNISPSQ